MRVLGAAGAFIAAASCADRPAVSPSSPLGPGQSRLSIAPRFQRTVPGGPTVTLTRLRGVLIGTNGDSSVVEALFQGDVAVLVFTVKFPGTSARYTLKLTGYDRNDVEAYSGTQEYTVKAGDNPGLPAPELVYTAPDSKLASLRISPAALNLDAGGSASLSVSGTGTNNAPISPILVAWSSKNAGVASVDANGGVRAGSFQGSTYIVARSYTGIADSILVKVKAPVAKVIVAPASLELIRGTSGAAAATLRDAGDNLIDDRSAAWSSSDPSVATVTSAGAIQGLKIGSATITASAEGKTGTVAVKVVSPVDRIELTPASLSLSSLGEKQTIGAKIVPRPGGSVDGVTPAFASSNAAVASVDAAGRVTANQNGTATITVSADGITSTAAVTVKQVAASISVSPRSATASAIGDVANFSASVRDALGNEMPATAVSWSSTNPSVASVAGGVATARGAGSTSVVATADGKSDAATFSVSQIPRGLVVSIDRNPVVVGAPPGVLTARTLDANGNVIGVVPASYSTDTPTLVSVSGNQVTGLANGAARVTGTTSGLSSTVGFLVTGGAAASLTLTPSTAEKLPNGTQQFTVATGGSGPFTWKVNGVTGGNSTYGTINASGFYTAPAAVPSPATFDVCAVQASPSATGCASVTIKAVPSGGADVIVFNDINTFDSPGDGDANNHQMFRNLVNFTGTGPRTTQTGVMFYTGHASQSVFSFTTLRSTITQAGFTIVDEAAAFTSPIPANIKTIFLLLPTTSFSATEINNLKGFAGDGGRIVFIGEHSQFYAGIAAENAFFLNMGAQMTNVGGTIDCGFAIEPQSSLRPHQVLTGVTQLTIACASQVIPGPNDYPFLYDLTGTKVLAAVAKIDLAPITTTAVQGNDRIAASRAAMARGKLPSGTQPIDPSDPAGRPPRRP